MRKESRLTQRMDMSTIVDSRCLGCPAVMASEIGQIVLEADPICRNLLVPVRDSDEAGCRKGFIEEGKLLMPHHKQDNTPTPYTYHP